MSIKLRLTAQSDSTPGQRLRVPGPHFLIGRSSSCDLTLSSATVSRRHAQIDIRGDEVWAIDLGSRNRTTIDNVPIEANKPARLWHGQVLRIGNQQFRVSLRDAQTRQPHRPPGMAGDDPLLSELDELANTLTSPGGTFPKPSGDDSTNPATQDVTTDAHDQLPGVVPAAEPSPVAEAAPDEENEATVEEDSDFPTTEVRGIPKHLRPTGPADSKAAADQALRRLFTR